jgi:hypothetical protein
MAWFKIGRVTDRDLGVDRLAHYQPVRSHEVSVSLVA